MSREKNYCCPTRHLLIAVLLLANYISAQDTSTTQGVTVTQATGNSVLLSSSSAPNVTPPVQSTKLPPPPIVSMTFNTSTTPLSNNVSSSSDVPKSTSKSSNESVTLPTSSVTTSNTSNSSASIATTEASSSETTNTTNANAKDQTTPTLSNSTDTNKNDSTNKENTTITTSPSPPTLPPRPSNQFSIYFVNDLQYDIFPVYPDDGTLCVTDGDKCVGGLARLDSYIKTVLRSYPNSSLWLNAGNMLGGDWFKLLKYETALETNKFLQFNFVTVGPGMFQYGRDASEAYLEDLGSKVLISNVDVLNMKKSASISWGECSVSVVGFVDDTNLQEHSTHGISVNSLMESLENELNKIKSEQNSSKLITIALGSASREKANMIANSIEGIDFIIYSGGCSTAENSSDYFCWDAVNKTNEKMTYVGSLAMKHTFITSRFLVGEVQITVGDNCKIEKVENKYFDYLNYTRDPNALDLTKKLFDLNNTLTENTQNLTGENDNCSHSECLLGNLLTDSMLIAVKENDLWNVKGSRIAVFPAIQFQANKTIPQNNVTATELYNVVKEDAYIYTVKLTGKELKEMICISLNSKLLNNSSEFLHLSGLLQAQYNTTTDNHVQNLFLRTVPPSSVSMKLEDVDLSDNKTIYRVTIPYTLFKMESYKKLLSEIDDSMISFHNMTVIEALSYYIKQKEFLTLPLVGNRQIKLEAPPSIPELECSSNTGTTILVTLVVTAVFLGGCYGVWWYIFRRNRARSASTMAMINMD